MSKMTPMMEQYWAIKSSHPDKLLLFRLGDFFELFFEDALQASAILSLTLTQRNKKAQNKTPMCGFPHHTLPQQVNKLLEAGHKVVIYDQIEESPSDTYSFPETQPAPAGFASRGDGNGKGNGFTFGQQGRQAPHKIGKKVIHRAITHILTPGMVYDCETLQDKSSHYLASVDASSASFMDISTGECFYFLENSSENDRLESGSFKQLPPRLAHLLEVLPVAELVQPSSWREEEKGEDKDKEGKRKEAKHKEGKHNLSFTISYFDSEKPLAQTPEIEAILGVGVGVEAGAIRAEAGVVGVEAGDGSGSGGEVPTETPPPTARLLLSYVIQLGGKEKLLNLKPFYRRDFLSYMHLSGNTLKHLEVLQDYRGEQLGSLYGAIRRTKTAFGARLLEQWLSFPLQNVNQLNERLDQVQWWHERESSLRQLQSLLRPMGDMERILSKLARPQCSPRSMMTLAHCLELLEKMDALTENSPRPLSKAGMEVAKKVRQEILKTLVDEPPGTFREEGMIRSGVNADLDEVISLAVQGQNHLLKMEAEERHETGIPSLKIRYNSVFGYYIEVTHIHKEKIPPHYVRKQTLAQAERFSTEALRELETKILKAQEQRLQMEQTLFTRLQQKVVIHVKELLHLASACAHLDVVSSLAWLAIEQRYVRPRFLSRKRGEDFLLKQSRHPVVEQRSFHSFIPNDFSLSLQSCLLLTGPNMAGKSTLMRQVALSVIMAQIGSFVPATEARLPVFDRIFTRIGASDYLSEGLSTFMVEMQETSEMLRGATHRSLLILDEVGRGTGTFDGLSLAQAILEYILNTCQSLTLFATHYHQLTEMVKSFPQLKNAHMQVEGNPQSGRIEFLYQLKEGATRQSYGIHVARLAGLPSSVTQRAESLLNHFENPLGT